MPDRGRVKRVAGEIQSDQRAAQELRDDYPVDARALQREQAALDGKAGWRRVLRTPMRAVRRNSILVVYVRTTGTECVRVA